MRDEVLFSALRSRYPNGSISEVEVEGDAVVIRTARPGILIGKQGKVAEEIATWLREQRGPDTKLQLVEIRRAEIDAVLVADAVAMKLAREVPLERAVNMQAEMAMRAGAKGCRIVASGGVMHEFSVGELDAAKSKSFTTSREWEPPYTVDDDGNEVPPPPREGPPPVFTVTVTISD
ncbi:MAG: KH domain-containing protein [Archangium sp.]